MTTQRTLLTADDLILLPGDGQRYELIDGELHEMTPPGGEHGSVASNVHGELRDFVKPRRLGRLFINDAGIILRRGPDTVRGPDICFFASGRLPGNRPPRGYIDICPDFVAEVVSPNDTASEVEQKIREWLAAGVRLVWVVHPDLRSVTAYRSLTDIRVYTEDQAIDGDPVFAGLAIPVAAFFE